MTTFSTSDFPLATSLVCLGFPIDHIDRSSSQERVKFNFAQSEELNEAIQAFWRKEVKIEPLLFCSTQKFLKSRIYSN